MTNRRKSPASSPRMLSEDDETQVGPPMKPAKPLHMSSQPTFSEDDETRTGLPSKSHLPPPHWKTPASSPRMFSEDDETRVGLPSKSELPPPMSTPRASRSIARPATSYAAQPEVDPQYAVDPDEAVTQIAAPRHASDVQSS